MPVLARLQSEYEDEGLRVLAINVAPNASLEDWTAFVEGFIPSGMEDLIPAMAAHDTTGEAIPRYELYALGTEILLDPGGQIAFRSNGPAGADRLASEIEDTLR